MKKLKYLLLLLLIPILPLFNACGEPSSKLQDSFEIIINGKTLTLQDEKIIRLDELSIENGLTVNVEENDFIVSTNYYNNSQSDAVQLNLNQAFYKVEITRNSFLQVKVEDDFKNKIESTIYLAPEDLPRYEAQGVSVGDNNYYFTTYQASSDGITEPETYLMKVSGKGELLYYKKVQGETYDFQKVITTDKKVRYLYIQSDRELFNKEDYGINASLVYAKVVVLDENYNFVQELVYDYGNGEISGVELHDILYLNDNHYIMCTNDARTLSGEDIPSYMQGDRSQNMYVVSCQLHEVKDGEIVWSFDSMDYPELYAYYSTEISDWTEEYIDYMHFNSLCLSNDGNLLVSFRNISGIMKISRQTGEKLWLLGGAGDEFNLEDSFGHQHEVTQLSNGNILLYDNGIFGEVSNSRIIEISVGEQNRTAEIVKCYNLDLASFAMGSVTKIQEDVYVYCYGVPIPQMAYFAEMDFSRDVVNFSLRLIDFNVMYNVNYC